MFGFFRASFVCFWPCVCALCFKWLCLPCTLSAVRGSCLSRSWHVVQPPQEPPETSQKPPRNHPETTHTDTSTAGGALAKQNAHQICIILPKVTFCTNRGSHIRIPQKPPSFFPAPRKILFPSNRLAVQKCVLLVERISW